MRVGYEKLSIEAFGKHLLESSDLDPIYVALVEMKMNPVTLERWLLAYWCCYDSGVSSYIADALDAGEYWRRFRLMAENVLPSPLGGRWRRAAERRHWRGKNALASLDALEARYRYQPEGMARYCAIGNEEVPVPATCADIMKRAREHVGFGPWIGFKIADMVERVMGVPVSFEQAEVFVFKDPLKAAEMFWDQNFTVGEDGVRKSSSEILGWVVKHLTHEFRNIPAPPGWDRPVGLQEVETVLCKWKSHINGHYPLNNDLIEIRHHILPWVAHSKLATRFLAALPNVNP